MDAQRLTLGERLASAFIGSFFGSIVGGVLGLFCLTFGRDVAANVFLLTLAVFSALGFMGPKMLGDFFALFARLTALLTVLASGVAEPAVEPKGSWFRPLIVLVIFFAFVSGLFYLIVR